MSTDALRLIRMADLWRLAIPGQNKTPRKGLTFAYQKPRGFEFSNDGQIMLWEAAKPEQWLLRTGRPDPETRPDLYLVVVDADNKAAVAMCEELLPFTPWQVKTPHGTHYYYVWENPTPEMRKQRRLGGLDRKAGPNAYVVAPGNDGYTPSPDWGIGWPPTLTFRQWMMLEDAWVAARSHSLADTGDVAVNTGASRRTSSGPRPGASRWKNMVQRCHIHAVCEGRRNSYLRDVLMRFLFRCRRKDGHYANRARVWNYLTSVNDNNFGEHRLSLTEVSDIVTKGMRDVREQYSEAEFNESQARKGRLSGYRRGTAEYKATAFAAKRNLGIVAARAAGLTVKTVASIYGLTQRHVSRLAPTRGPRCAKTPPPLAPGAGGGQRGRLNVIFVCH